MEYKCCSSCILRLGALTGHWMLSLLHQVQTGLIPARSLVVAESSKRILSLELSSSRHLEKCHNASINTLDIDQVEGRYLLSGAFDGGMYIHDLYNTSGEPSYTMKCVAKFDGSSSHRYSVASVQWYPPDTGLFTSSSMDKQLRVWDTNLQRCVEQFIFPYHVNAHHVSSQNSSLIAAIEDGISDMSEVEVGESYPLHIATFNSKYPPIRRILIKNILVIKARHLRNFALSYSTTALVDLRVGCTTHELQGHNKGKVRVVKWSPYASNLLATGGTDHRLLLWDVRSAKTYLKSLDMYNEGQTKSKKASATAHFGTISSLCFTPDGLYLISWGNDNYLRLWDVANGRNTMVNYGVLFNSNALRSIQIDVSYDTKPAMVFVPKKSTVVCLDLFNGWELGSLSGHFTSVNCCALRQGYQELYTGGSDRNLLLWTPDTAQEAAYEESGQKPPPTNTSKYLNKITGSMLERPCIMDQWSDSD
ncbi:ERCC8 [Cordylochernes scorpioides]|uniref:ERCC8 n=1 Tax=Cordylochernes scorpioides TaxID=51811 RepID=A0ABY6KJN9_9ARAC|nr:ERCC8 [Cordylochernes scorpioides]